MPHATLLPGFDDPVTDSQAVFRATLEALSRPGKIVALPPRVQAPAPLSGTTGAIALALADLDAPVWLDPTLKTEEVAAWLRFHAGCPVTEAPEQAAFALIGEAGALTALDRFAIGTPTFPDRSTTLVVQVDGLRNSGRCLSGPGIKDSIALTVDGLADGFWTAWAGNTALFPQGVDVIFTTDRALCGLPRTSRVETD